VREEIGPGSFDYPQDVRAFLKNVASRYRANNEAFIAILPCINARKLLIGLVLLKPDLGPLERIGLVEFLKYPVMPKVSTFQVPATHDPEKYRSFGPEDRVIVRLAPNCLLSPSDYTIGLLPNSGSVEDPITFYVKSGTIGRLSIKVIDSHHQCFGFVVILHDIDPHVKANCVAVRDGDTIEKAIEEAHKKLQSNNETNEIRTPLAGRYEAVVKFRIGSTERLVLVGVEEIGVNR
jgi:hypothetical protein